MKVFPNKSNILQHCWDIFKLSEDVFENYNDPNRFYHNWEHLLYMFKVAGPEVSEELFLAILFHDIVYNPKGKNNEIESAKFFSNVFSYENNYRGLTSQIVNKIHNAITETAHPSIPYLSSPLGVKLIELDLAILNCNDMKKYMDFEHGIFKEFQFLDFDFYRKARADLLIKLKADSVLVDYVLNYQPKIGIYAGSFNPFHKGHLNILQKAEKLFDKVIVAQGINPDKVNNKKYELPQTIRNRQIEKYDGLFTDFVKKLNYQVTLIRGLRDANDLLYESTQISFLKDLMPDLNVIEIICDKEYSHISSSAIRNLEIFTDKTKFYMVE